MCGIIGAIGYLENRFDVSVNCITHRGPDSKGIYLNENVYLGHTRLSIQDLSANGNQPMFSSDGRYVIIFNGEIYNHNELRDEMLKDIVFKSTGDTETVLYAYINYGTEILNKLNGIFAFAIYDNETNEIFIARDQLGVKPLYYYLDQNKFLFGSELKAFIPLNIKKDICTNSLFNYLTFLWSPGQDTPFTYVKKLLPGNYLKFNASDFSNIIPLSYYKWQSTKSKVNLSEKEFVDELEKKLLKSVERQMLSDVPVGFFLSGGLDSSLLVAMARKLYPSRDFKCYTIDVGANKSESEGFVSDIVYAKKVAKYLNVELNVVKADLDILDLFDKMIWHLDEPQADAAPLNVYKISSLAREQNIKVLIGGVAGDDLFSGYRRHLALNLEKYIKNSPIWFLSLISSIIKFTPSKIPLFRRLKKLFSNIDLAPRERHLSYFEWLPHNKVFSLFSEEYKHQLKNHDPFLYFKELEKEVNSFDSDLDRILYWELRTFLVDHNLNYTDKLGMAVGVEARVPYLDLELVEFSQLIPANLKLHNKEVKYILKKVAERYLPKDVIYRSKTGFGAPVREWIINDLDALIKDRLSPEKISKRGIFNPQKVWKLIEDNKAGKVDASYSIWCLLAIESWCMQFIDEVKLA